MTTTEPRTNAPDTAGVGLAAEVAELVGTALGGPLPVALRLWDGSGTRPVDDDGTTVVVTSPNAVRRMLWHPGELGLAQAYVLGEIDVEGDLGAGLRRMWAARSSGAGQPLHPPTALDLVRSTPAALQLARRLGALGPPLAPPRSQARLRGRLHSNERDRAAIAHHYDLSNDFYSLILDPQMVYSCGFWRSDDADYGLADAQADKLDLVCRKLQLASGDRLLDIGCGWGATAIHAAAHYGARVTAVTLSRQQAEFARARVASLGLDEWIDVRVQDYRELVSGGDLPFDAVSSLEMGEHVGAANYPTYTATLHDMVRPGGRVLVQQMSRRENAPGGGAFIEAFIAPDMHMRPVGDTVSLIEDAGLEVVAVQALRKHYVRTIEAWHETFESRWDEAVRLVGEEMARVWRLYLVGSALSFEQGRMGVDQIVAVRPRHRG